MDSHTAKFPMMGGLQPLDFTSFPKHESPEPEPEPPVLDLSCKKYSVPKMHPMPQSPPILDRSMYSPTDEQMNGERYANAERKSPFEGRSYMVTPPSESDSPKKTKYEPIYNQINSTTNDLAVPIYPQIPIPLPASVSQSGMPNLIPQNQSSPIPLQGSPLHSPEMTKKVPRPFKAYPKDPLSLTMGTTELIYDQNSNEAYSEFRKRMLDSVKKTNEGTNIKMRRTTKSPGLPTSTMDDKDAAYWERRRKNNEAAKRSRDARRAKEDEIAIRAAFLEQENIKLKYELVALRNETAKLRCMVYTN